METQQPSPSKRTPLLERFLPFLRTQRGGLIVLAVFILFPFAYGWLTGTSAEEGASKFWQGQLISFFIMAVLAMSYDILMGYTGILSFGHAAFFGGGAYAMALFLTHIAQPIIRGYRIEFIAGLDITEPLLFIAGIVVVIVVSIVLGLLFSATSARVKGVYFAMITLAIAQAIHILSKATDFIQYTGADEGLHGIPVPLWLNPTQFRLRFYFVALAFTVIMFLLLRRFVNSPTGRVMAALRDNESRVQMVGYNPAIFRTIAFIVSSTVAGLAGAMYSLWNMSATPTMTSALMTINALIMTILGGIGTLVGPILGAGLLQVVGQFFYEWFGPRWPLVFGVLFIALVLFLPYGIVGTWRLKAYGRKQAWERFKKLLKV